MICERGKYSRPPRSRPNPQPPTALEPDSRSPGLVARGFDVNRSSLKVSRPASGRAGSGHAQSDRGRCRVRCRAARTGTSAAPGCRGRRSPDCLGDSQSSHAMDPTGSAPAPVLRPLSPTSPTRSRQEASSSWELLLLLCWSPNPSRSRPMCGSLCCNEQNFEMALMAQAAVQPRGTGSSKAASPGRGRTRTELGRRLGLNAGPRPRGAKPRPIARKEVLVDRPGLGAVMPAHQLLVGLRQEDAARMIERHRERRKRALEAIKRICATAEVKEIELAGEGVLDDGVVAEVVGPQRKLVGHRGGEEQVDAIAVNEPQ